MRVDLIEVRRSDLRQLLLPRLLGTVFHVTSGDAIEKIITSGIVLSNKDGILGFTYPQSRASYGRQQGYVCLFDFRDVTDEHLQDALLKFSVLNPPGAQDCPAFLFLKKSAYGDLISWRTAPTSAMLIPHVETWYPDDLPVTSLEGALAVEILPDDPDSAFRAAMRHVEERDLISGSSVLLGQTIEDLKRRVEQWRQHALAAGLMVDEWDLDEVREGPAGYEILLRVERPQEEWPYRGA